MVGQQIARWCNGSTGDSGSPGVGSNPARATNNLIYAEIAQLVERDLAKVQVAGSSPVFRSRICSDQDSLAQLAEQLTLNQRVQGSSP